LAGCLQDAKSFDTEKNDTGKRESPEKTLTKQPTVDTG
jgi:hypothetical protein